MGNDSGLTRERPSHKVSLDNFYIDIYEVTNARYAECVKEGGCTESDCVYCQRSGYENHPVVSVDWSQAQAYCQWRGARLPTEVEWEKAARGGLEGKKYPWGDEEPSCQLESSSSAQVADCGGQTTPGHTVQVGSFGANGYGLYDMIGNAMEWVWDWYLDTYYYQSPFQNPQGPEDGTDRIARGGAWFTYSNISSVSFRRPEGPAERLNYLGFRCARSP